MALPGGGTLVYDAALDETRLGVIDQMVKLAMQRLGASYGRSPAGPVGVVVTTVDLNGFDFHGDASQGRMMSLRLPLHSDPSQAAVQIQRVVAHEVTHWWNAGVFSSDSHQPWLHEGHAEWTALLIMRSQNIMSREDLLAHLEGALNRCLFVRGDRPAATLNAGFGPGDDPYACGLSLMLLAQVQNGLRGQDPSQPSPLNRLATLHQYGRELDAAGFAAWADGAAQEPVRRLLLDPSASFAPGLVERIKALSLGEGRPIQPGMVLPPALSTPAATQLMRGLMASDCGGPPGFWTRPDAFKLDERMTCQTLRLGQEAMALNGVSLLADPAGAWQVLTERCAGRDSATGRPLTIQYRQGPGTDMACPVPLHSMPIKYVISLDKSALAKLGL